MSITEITTTHSPREYRQWLSRKTKDELVNMIVALERELEREEKRTVPRAAFGFRIVVDPSIPNDTIKMVDSQGYVLGTIIVPPTA